MHESLLLSALTCIPCLQYTQTVLLFISHIAVDRKTDFTWLQVMWTQDVQESQGRISSLRLNNSYSLLLNALAPKTAKPEQKNRPSVALLHA